MNQTAIKQHLNEIIGEALRPTVNEKVQAAIDRMDDIGNVWKLISELSNPDENMPLDRDNMASALGFLQREYEQARERFSESLRDSFGVSL